MSPGQSASDVSSGSAFLLLADLVLVVHFAFLLFAVCGFVAIVFGRFAGQNWIYNAAFRLSHLGAIAFVVVQAWLGRLCPLTIWENALRVRAGQAGHDVSIVAYWLRRWLYYDAEPWIFGVAYTVFGLLLLAAVIADWSKIRPKNS